MKKVRITVLKTMLNEDLAKEYGFCDEEATIDYTPVACSSISRL